MLYTKFTGPHDHSGSEGTQLNDDITRHNIIITCIVASKDIDLTNLTLHACHLEDKRQVITPRDSHNSLSLIWRIIYNRAKLDVNRVSEDADTNNGKMNL